MTLQDKNIMVFAATGAIGSGVARHLAAQGARVHVSGRDPAAVRRLAGELNGSARSAVVDATDAGQIGAAVDRFAEEAGSVDAVFNAIGLPPAELNYPKRLEDLDLDGFLEPSRVILGSTFLTAQAAGRRMAAQGHGSIVTLSATLSGHAFGWMASLTATCGAIEAMTRSLAGELGASGVRVNCVRADAMPETTTIQQTGAGQARLAGIDLADFAMPPTTLGRPLTVLETAATVAFLASDASSGMTAQTVTVSGSPLLG